MFSLRSKSEPARESPPRYPLLLAVCAAFAAIPRSPPRPLPKEKDRRCPSSPSNRASYDFGLHEVNSRKPARLLPAAQHRQRPGAGVLVLPVTGSGSSAFWTGKATASTTPEPNETCSVQVNFNPNEVDALLGPAARRIRRRHQLHRRPERRRRSRPQLTAASNPTNFGASAVGSRRRDADDRSHQQRQHARRRLHRDHRRRRRRQLPSARRELHRDPARPGSDLQPTGQLRAISTGAKTARLVLFGEGDGGSQITLTGIGTEAESAAAGSPNASGLCPQASGKRRVMHRSPAAVATAAPLYPYPPAGQAASYSQIG